MKFGFALKRITLTGPGLDAAEITFARGLNVIAGPSDSGKSFVAQCIDYALGSSDAPEEIPEAERYTTVALDIESNRDQRIFTLERGMRGGDVRLTSEGIPQRILAAQHQSGKEDTVSQFLLDLSGLKGKKVRTNKQGATRQLSFRDLAPLVLVDEVDVMKKSSPVLSGQYVLRTPESAVFRLLITGTDDSAVIAKEDLKTAKGRQAGKVELLELLLRKTREDLATFGDIGSLSDGRQRCSRLEALLQDAIKVRDADQESASLLEIKRHEAWKRLRATDSELAVLVELQKRFDLLQLQYATDLRRLEAINEASARLAQLKEERCPMCGATAEHHDSSHQFAHFTSDDVSRACIAEGAKTNALVGDLRLTRETTSAKIQRLTSEQKAHQTDLDNVTGELRTLLENRVKVTAARVDDVRARLDTCKSSLELLMRAQDLESLLAEASIPRKSIRAEGPATTVTTGQAEHFNQEVEKLLEAWHYPKLDRVTYSEKDQDIVVSGRARQTHGKGVRAILRTAFNLGLLRLCVREERPFPSFVLIDSPLIVYEDPDPGENEFPQDVKKHFWNDLKNSFQEVQVIIIENTKQLPRNNGIEGANVVVFTGNDQGRRGFIPT